MYIRLINAAELNKLKDNDHYGDDYWKSLTHLPFITTSAQQLPGTKDYQQHSVEIKIDALQPGSYALIGSSSAAFNDSTDKLMIQQFDVSSISYIKTVLIILL
jgi:hypothetical protein